MAFSVARWQSLCGTNIAFFEESPAGALGDIAGRGLAFFDVDIENHDGGAHLEEAERDAAPDAGAGSCHDGNFTFKREQADGGFGNCGHRFSSELSRAA